MKFRLGSFFRPLLSPPRFAPLRVKGLVEGVVLFPRTSLLPWQSVDQSHEVFRRVAISRLQ